MSPDKTKATEPEAMDHSPAVEETRPAATPDGRPRRMPDLQRAANPALDGDAGAADRARQSATMQQQVGNARMGETASNPGDGAAIMRQPAAPQPPISTPLPPDAARNRQGAAEFEVGGAAVTVQPDTRSLGMRNRARTNFSLHAPPPRRPRISAGRVVEVRPTPQVRVTIRTTYGRGVTAQSLSGYGRGTTATDIAAGQTSLGHHEGSHGQDYQDFLRNNPLPEFGGRVGMTEREYDRAEREYRAAMRRYTRAMAAQSHMDTDCVGIPADDCGP